MAASTSQPRYPLTRWRSLSSITHVRTASWGDSSTLPITAGVSIWIVLNLSPLSLAATQAIQMACAQSWWSRASRGHRRSRGGRMSGRFPGSPWSWSAGLEQDNLEKSGWVSDTDDEQRLRGRVGHRFLCKNELSSVISVLLLHLSHFVQICHICKAQLLSQVVGWTVCLRLKAFHQGFSAVCAEQFPQYSL